MAQILINSYLGLLKLQFIELGWSTALSSKKPSEIVSAAPLRGVSSPSQAGSFTEVLLPAPLVTRCASIQQGDVATCCKHKLLPHFGFEEADSVKHSARKACFYLERRKKKKMKRKIRKKIQKCL